MSPKDTIEAGSGRLGAIRGDACDLRDRYFEPALTPLAPKLDPEPKLLSAIRNVPVAPLPRDQGQEGSCGGHALAALIDIERLRAAITTDRPEPVSARMLQTMATRHDGSNIRDKDGVSLRDVIKGFFNYGVCPESKWPYVAGDRADLMITPDRAKASRDVALGAYYRLRPNLNIYHSALRESGAVLVSAELHDGWNLQATGRLGAISGPQYPGAGGYYSGGHAFVLIGYDQDGFLILNSWGRGWGGAVINGVAYPGIAHWTYGDWADSIMDGWALRLGVRAPEAFEYSIGDMGLGLAGPVRASRSAPVRTILGHYIHLDDGEYVTRGAFPSDASSLEETLKLLAKDAEDGEKRRYRGLLLTLGGALLNLTDAAGQIAQLKTKLWKERETTARTWYPITALWCVDYVDEARDVLEGVFSRAMGQIGKPGDDLDRLIEARAHGVGRALWRDIRSAARRTASPKGPINQLLRGVERLAAIEPDFGVCLVAEGEGYFVLDALVATLARDPARARAFYSTLRSVDVVAPPAPAADVMKTTRRLSAGWRAVGRIRRARLHLPTAADLARLGVTPYGRSFFELVERSFLGRAGDASAAANNMSWEAWKRRRGVLALPIRWPDGMHPKATARIQQRELIYASDIFGRVRATLAEAD